MKAARAIGRAPAIGAEAARRLLQEKHKDWLSTFIVERVEPPDVAAAIRRLVKEQGCRLIFTLDDLRCCLAAAEKALNGLD